MSDLNIKETVENSVDAIKQGPLPLKLYSEICAKCGTCATVCPVYYGKEDKSLNPAVRSDRIRNLYKRNNTLLGKLFSKFSKKGEFKEEEIQEWIKEFYECTGCRRCATYCPFGIDNSVITRKGRAIIDKCQAQANWLGFGGVRYLFENGLPGYIWCDDAVRFQFA